MKILLAILCIVGLAVLWLVLRRVWFYRAMFSQRHLGEVAAALAKLRHAALEGSTNLDPQVDDPRALLTSAGLVILYTIRKQPGAQALHHVSVSLGGGYTPDAVGSYFLIFVLKGLGVDPQQVDYSISTARMFHAEWSLSSSLQKQFAKQQVPPITDTRALWKECVTLRPQLDFKRNQQQT